MKNRNVGVYLIIIGLFILLLLLHGMIGRPINLMTNYFIYIEHFGATFLIPLFIYFLLSLKTKESCINFWFTLGITFGLMFSLLVYDLCQYCLLEDHNFNQIYQIISGLLGILISLIVILILGNKKSYPR